jgi:2,3,4,5-tetrahydropyridine-2-carboxylate N-succinyltransferase
MSDKMQSLVEAAFANRDLLRDAAHEQAVREALRELDAGRLRVATQRGPGDWETHAWLKQAVLLYFGLMPMQVTSAGPIQFYDKIPLKTGLDTAGVRVVPPGTIRYGAFVEAGAIVMPGYVNIGAYVGAGTWSTHGPRSARVRRSASAVSSPAESASEACSSRPEHSR